MGIVRRCSRKVSVDGQEYIWKLSGCRKNQEGPVHMTLTIGLDTLDRGQVLQCRLASKAVLKYEDFTDTLHVSFTPKDVEKVIRMALSIGWSPAAKKPPVFRFGQQFDFKDFQIESR